MLHLLLASVQEKPSAAAASDNDAGYELNMQPIFAAPKASHLGSQKSESSSAQGSFFCGDRPVLPEPKECSQEEQGDEKQEPTQDRTAMVYIGDSAFPKDRLERNEIIQRSLSIFAIGIESQLDETPLQNINFPLIENLPHENFWTHAPCRWDGKRLFLVACTLDMFNEIATALFLSDTIVSTTPSLWKILTIIGLTGLTFLFETKSDHQQEDKSETLCSLMEVLWKQVEWSEHYLIPSVKAFEEKVAQAEETGNAEVLEEFLTERMRLSLFSHKESVRGIWMYMKALKAYLENCYETLKELEQFEKEENAFWTEIKNTFFAWAKVGILIASLFKISGFMGDIVLCYVGQIASFFKSLIQYVAGSSAVVIKEGNTHIAQYTAQQVDFKTKVEAYRETSYRLGLQKCIHKGMAGEIKKIEKVRKEAKSGNCFSQFFSNLAYPFKAFTSWCMQEKNDEEQKLKDWYASRDRRPSVIFPQYLKEKPRNNITLF